MKKSITLDVDKILGIGHLLNCCNKHHQVHDGEMEDSDSWHCLYCDKPLMVKVSGRHYMLGEDVTI